MKITRSELKKIIVEEIEKIDFDESEVLSELELAQTAGSVGKRMGKKLGSLSVFDAFKEKLSQLKGTKKADALVSLLLQAVPEQELVDVVTHLKTKLGGIGKEEPQVQEVTMPEPAPEI
tara:strand:- start:1540 stop:1896 length:357 start_codon:yes stop_codon:yes gene_type:complete